MAIQVQKVLSIEAGEFQRLILIAKARRAEIIRLQNDYFESKVGEETRNRVHMQKEEIARLESLLDQKKAQLASMRHAARNSKSELAKIDADISQHNENLSARYRLDKMSEMRSLFNAMKKAGITPPELGTTVTQDDIVS